MDADAIPVSESPVTDEVMEDTETTIHCNARKAYPKPTFLWSPPESLTLGSQKTVESYNNQTHEYSSYSSVIYNAKLTLWPRRLNETIICATMPYYLQYKTDIMATAPRRTAHLCLETSHRLIGTLTF